MKNLRKQLVILVSFCLCACTTFQPLAGSGPIADDIRAAAAAGTDLKPGDRIRLTTTDGSIYEFRITDITDDLISGTEASVPIADIVTLEVREHDTGKPTGLVAGIVLIVLAIGYLAGKGLEDSFENLFSGR